MELISVRRKKRVTEALLPFSLRRCAASSPLPASHAISLPLALFLQISKALLPFSLRWWSLCSLHVMNLVEYLVWPLDLGLKDGSAYVRTVAAMGVLKLYHISAPTCLDADFIGNLKQLMLNDTDTQVVANCLSALQEIWSSEASHSKEATSERDGLLSKPFVYYLLNRIREFSEWAQRLVLELMSKYVPSESDEILIS